MKIDHSNTLRQKIFPALMFVKFPVLIMRSFRVILHFMAASV